MTMSVHKIPGSTDIVVLFHDGERIAASRVKETAKDREVRRLAAEARRILGRAPR